MHEFSVSIASDVCIVHDIYIPFSAETKTELVLSNTLNLLYVVLHFELMNIPVQPNLIAKANNIHQFFRIIFIISIFLYCLNFDFSCNIFRQFLL